MRRTITIAALTLLIPLAAACSDDGPVAPTDDLGLEGVAASELVSAADLGDLSEEDRARVREILRTARESIQMLREAVRNGTLTIEEARARSRAVHDDTLAALSEILSDEQLERLRNRLRRVPAGPPGGPPSGERPDLDLTEEQRAEIAALHEAMRAFLAEVREAVRAGEISAEEGRARVRERAAALRASVCAVLTEDQRAEVEFCADGS